MEDRRRTDTRERMIRAALDLYRERGMQATGFSDVVAAAGAARGAIYHHFPGGKDELAAEVVRANGEELAGLLRRLLARRTTASAIQAFVDWYSGELERTGLAFGCPIAPTVLEAALESDRIAEEATRAFGSWADVIAEGLVSEGVGAARAQRIGTMAVAAIEGALILCRARRDVDPLREVMVELVEVIEAARPGPT